MEIYESQATFIPSDVYLTVPDFSVILEDIAKGVLPTGTNRPFPIFSTPENEELHNALPWNTSSVQDFISGL